MTQQQSILDRVDFRFALLLGGACVSDPPFQVIVYPRLFPGVRIYVSRIEQREVIAWDVWQAAYHAIVVPTADLFSEFLLLYI